MIAMQYTDVRLCIFCEKEAVEIELTYSEDVELSHKCLENFNQIESK